MVTNGQFHLESDWTDPIKTVNSIQDPKTAYIQVQNQSNNHYLGIRKIDGQEKVKKNIDPKHFLLLLLCKVSLSIIWVIAVRITDAYHNVLDKIIFSTIRITRLII
jgi:hypothetical protein